MRAVSCLNLEEYELSSSPSIATFVLFLEGSRSELVKPFGSRLLGELDGLPSPQSLLVRIGIAVNENSVVGLGELSLQPNGANLQKNTESCAHKNQFDMFCKIMR